MDVCGSIWSPAVTNGLWPLASDLREVTSERASGVKFRYLLKQKKLMCIRWAI